MHDLLHSQVDKEVGSTDVGHWRGSTQERGGGVPLSSYASRRELEGASGKGRGDADASRCTDLDG